MAHWSYGDCKLDRKGRKIFFVGYSEELSIKGKPIELWEPEAVFLTRAK